MSAGMFAISDNEITDLAISKFLEAVSGVGLILSSLCVCEESFWMTRTPCFANLFC